MDTQNALRSKSQTMGSPQCNYGVRIARTAAFFGHYSLYFVLDVYRKFVMSGRRLVFKPASVKRALYPLDAPPA
jgi:hypothetical protein